jgi:hypothetical protein
MSSIQNFCIAANDNARDKESQYGKGIVAFEYGRFIGNVNRVIDHYPQTEFFWKAYHVAQDHFGTYRFRSIPTRSSYEEDILFLLGDLDYQREEFFFFPGEMGDSKKSEEDPLKLIDNSLDNDGHEPVISGYSSTASPAKSQF